MKQFCGFLNRRLGPQEHHKLSFCDRGLHKQTNTHTHTHTMQTHTQCVQQHQFQSTITTITTLIRKNSKDRIEPSWKATTTYLLISSSSHGGGWAGKECESWIHVLLHTSLVDKQRSPTQACTLNLQRSETEAKGTTPSPITTSNRH